MSEARTVRVRDLEISNDLPFVLIAGPCQIESEAHAFETADALRSMTEREGVGLIYKSSFDKANRTSAGSARGVGLEKGLAILAAVRERYRIPVLTDVHGPEQCDPAAEAVDVLQIPAFLCRQTDLLIAAGETGRTINVKKGQFLAPWDMARTGYPVVFDVTHSVQQPGGQGSSSGGQREFVPTLARAAAAVGVAALFIETHADPDHAPSDGPTMIPLRQMPALLARLRALDALTKERVASPAG